MKMFVWDVGDSGEDTIAVTAVDMAAARTAITSRIDAVLHHYPRSSDIRRSIMVYTPREYAVGEPLIVLGGLA